MTINLLALDTSSKACSVALVQNDKIHQVIELAERQQSKQILSQIQQLLQEAGLVLDQLQALAFACGPGSFTGIRLGASVIQGLAFGASLPVVPISTLQVIAQSAYLEFDVQQAAVAINAYGGKIYWGTYRLAEAGQMVAVSADTLCSPQEVILPNTDNEEWMGVGEGWALYKDILTERLEIQTIYDQLYPQAKYLASLALMDFMMGKFVHAEEALPVYLYGAERWKRSNTGTCAK